MRFLVYTSLTSLILIFIVFRIYFWFKKRFNRQLSTTHEIIKSGVGDFISDFNRGGLLYLANKIKDKFCSQLSSCVNVSDKADEFVNNLNNSKVIEKESIEYIFAEYKNVKKEFEKLKNKAIKNGDYESYNRISEIEEDVDDEFQDVINMRPFFHLKVLSRYIDAKTFELPK